MRHTLFYIISIVVITNCFCEDDEKEVFRVRKGCQCCHSCKPGKDERLRNRNLKSFNATKREIKKVFVKNIQITDQNIKDEIIKIKAKIDGKEELTEADRMFLTKENIKEEDLNSDVKVEKKIKSTVSCRYYNDESDIWFATENDIKGMAKNSASKFDAKKLSVETENALNHLKNKNKANSAYCTVPENGLMYKLMFYIGYGNYCKEIYDILFDIFKAKNKKEIYNSWQVKVLAGIKDKSTTSSEFDFKEMTLTFKKVSYNTFYHKVTNKFEETKLKDGGFEVYVDSSATRDGTLSTLMTPNIFTDIIYRCVYDSEADCTYLIILTTYHFEKAGTNGRLGFNLFQEGMIGLADFFGKFSNKVEEQGDIVFKNLIGKKFKEELEKRCPGIFGNKIKK